MYPPYMPKIDVVVAFTLLVGLVVGFILGYLTHDEWWKAIIMIAILGVVACGLKKM